MGLCTQQVLCLPRILFFRFALDFYFQVIVWPCFTQIFLWAYLYNFPKCLWAMGLCNEFFTSTTSTFCIFPLPFDFYYCFEGRRLQIWPCFTVKFICMLAYLLRQHFTTFFDVCEQFAQNIKRLWGEEYESPPVLNARTDDSAAWAGFQAKTLSNSKSNSDIMLHVDVIHQELCCPVCQIWKFRIPQTFHFIINTFVI